MLQRKKSKKITKLYFPVIGIGLIFSCTILFGLSINAEEASINSATAVPTPQSISATTTPIASSSETAPTPTPTTSPAATTSSEIKIENKTVSLTNSINQDTSPFWLNLRPKILEYLNKNINANIFKYELIGPTMPMKKFIGNVPNAAVTVSGFNPNSKSDMQTIIAKAANGEVISINIKLAKYRNILISKKNHEPNEILSIANFQTEKRTISPRDYDLYVDPPFGSVTINTKLATGSPLKRNMLVQLKIVKSGDYLRVVNESQHLKLEFRCQAVTSGTIGSIITVRCPDINKASVKAKVEDLGLARLL
jgi:flagella basal body P-ring formation protein FlgA